MSWFDGIKHRVRILLDPGSYERELRDEMRFHLELDEMQQHDPSRARRRFGNRTYYQEETRRMTPLAWLDVLRQDVRYGWRSIRRSPGFTLMIVVTLALGLGVNAATFTLLDRLYLRAPGGVVDPDGIQRLWFETSGMRTESGKAHASQVANHPMFRAVAGASADPGNMALYDTDNSLLYGSGNKRSKVRGVFASASYFTVLGVRPAMGRLYTAAEDSLGHGSNVTVVGHRFWRQTLGGDSAVLGKAIRIESQDYTVIGVLPPAFTGLDLQQADLWIPLGAIPAAHWIVQVGRGKPWWEGVNSWTFDVIRRLPATPDAGFEQRATLALREANKRMFPENPDTLANVLTGGIVGFGGPGEAGQDMIITTRLGGVALIVLLVACANVINLLLARAVFRRREIAVRLAVGISRGRLIRLLTTETLLLASLACAAAVLAAWWGGTLLRSLILPNVTWYESALHWRVVVFAIGMALLAGLVAGVIPAVQASRPDLTRALKDGSRDGSVHRSRLRNALVVAQAALSIMLLVGAALFVRSLNNVQNLDLGIEPKRLMYGTVEFQGEYKEPNAVVAVKMAEVEERLRGRPGIEAVARSAHVPMQAISFITFYWGADSSRSLQGSFPTLSPVSGNYFTTVGLRLLRGAAFEDRAGAPGQMVVNEAMAKLLWPTTDALGQCVHFEKRGNPCYTVVGVVENARRSNVIEPEAKPQFYLPLNNMPSKGYGGWTLLLRTTEEGARAAATELTGELRRQFPLGEATVKPFMAVLEPEYRPWRLGASLFTGFGLLALLVAVIGIYSTISYSVTQRTHEFGVRAALGARIGDVLKQVVGEGLRVVAIGVVVGIALALAAGKLISALLYDVKPGDPLVMTVVSIMLLGVAAVAALVPAWRAARVDPVTALRSE
jgi:putative ABC transport system permease protein